MRLNNLPPSTESNAEARPEVRLHVSPYVTNPPSEPVVCYKYAFLLPTKKGPRFKGLATAVSHPEIATDYGVDDAAVCTTMHHAQPTPDCNCGFWSVTTKADLRALYPHAEKSSALYLLEVELSGMLLLYDHGIRASHQRVLSVTVPPCYCQTRADGVAVRNAPLNLYTARCTRCIEQDSTRCEWPKTLTKQELSNHLPTEFVFTKPT